MSLLTRISFDLQQRAAMWACKSPHVHLCTHASAGLHKINGGGVQEYIYIYERGASLSFHWDVVSLSASSPAGLMVLRTPPLQERLCVWTDNEPKHLSVSVSMKQIMISFKPNGLTSATPLLPQFLSRSEVIYIATAQRLTASRKYHSHHSPHPSLSVSPVIWEVMTAFMCSLPPWKA